MFRFRSHVLPGIALTLVLSCVPFAKATRQHGLPGQAGSRVKTGIDVLEAANFAALRGKKVGLVTNQTGLDSRGRRTIDALAHASGMKLVAIFSPEHGLNGKADEVVANDTDPLTGLPVYSLYGATRRPTAEMLQNITALVFDMQDAGVRFYTYVTTMGYCMEEAAKLGIPFYVLDRPDPLGGDVIEGPMLDPDRVSFVGYFPMPVRYGMTLGELAQMFNAEYKIGAKLQVIAMQNWRRGELFDETGLHWIPPSPNLHTFSAAMIYPGIEILQAAGISVGRGTATPFGLIGAPWIKGGELAAELGERKIPGVRFAPVKFTPSEGLYKATVCGGVTITVTDRASFRAMRMGLEIADGIRHLYSSNIVIPKINDLLGSRSTMDGLEEGELAEAIVQSWTDSLQEFRATRNKYLLYN